MTIVVYTGNANDQMNSLLKGVYTEFEKLDTIMISMYRDTSKQTLIFL